MHILLEKHVELKSIVRLINLTKNHERNSLVSKISENVIGQKKEGRRSDLVLFKSPKKKKEKRKLHDSHCACQSKKLSFTIQEIKIKYRRREKKNYITNNRHIFNIKSFID